MRYWWVNHSQTARQELEGGYLWSPKCEANGARSQFYENMRKADPGDSVLSFASGRLGYAGRVTDFAFSSPKPESFGTVGQYWNDDGWLLPVAWTPLSQAVRPKPIIRDLRPWLPDKYSPIHPVTGNGNQKAYFAQVDQGLFDYLVAQGGGSDASSEQPSFDSSAFVARLEAKVEKQIEGDASLTASERRQVIKARYGQGLFRTRVSRIEAACRLTGIKNPALLIASHIKPWRFCTSTGERLDGANGLLLTPHVDRLFDRALIGFTNSGDVLVSPRIPDADISLLGLKDACGLNTGSFTRAQQHYLAYHRQMFEALRNGR